MLDYATVNNGNDHQGLTRRLLGNPSTLKKYEYHQKLLFRVLWMLSYANNCSLEQFPQIHD